MLAVLGGLADVERDLIRTRTAEGRSRAKARGKNMGRPPSLTSEQKKEAIRRRAKGATLQELADSYNVSRATISRLAVNAKHGLSPWTSTSMLLQQKFQPFSDGSRRRSRRLDKATN